MAGELILLVEDNEKNRKLAHDVLVHQGYRVSDAESAEEALRLVREQPPSLVLMDIHLPGMDGIAAFRQLRADPAALPSFTGVDLGEQGYAVVKVNKVLPREAPPPAEAKQERSQYADAWGGAENLAYYNLLKDRLKVQMLVPKPAGLQDRPAQ